MSLYKQFKEFLNEARSDSIVYVSKTKAGKKTDDLSKIVKVEGELYPSRGIVEYDALSEIAILLEEQK